jgi:hypothetical protein
METFLSKTVKGRIKKIGFKFLLTFPCMGFMEVKHGKIKHSYLNPYAPNLTSYLTSKTNIVNLRPLYLIILCAFVSYYPTLLLGQDKEWPVLNITTRTI